MGEHQCCGIGKNWRRCGRSVQGKWFCDDHKCQPFILIFFIIFTVLPAYLTIITFFFPQATLDPLYKRAISYKETGQNEKAFKLLRELYTKKPDYPNVAYYYGSDLKKKGDRREALAVLESVPANEKHVDLEYKKGFLYYALGNNQKATTCIAQAMRDLTINDNRYYLANALQVYLTNYDQGVERLKNAVNTFCDQIDYLLARESTAGNTSLPYHHLTVPTTDLFRSLEYTTALRDSAYLVISKLMELQFNSGQYDAYLESFTRGVKYVQQPQSFYLDVDEKAFMSFLERVDRALNALNENDYSKYEEADKALDSVERKNMGTHECIYEMSHLIRMVYFNKKDEFVSKSLVFTLMYSRDVKWDKPVYLIKVRSPEYISGNKNYQVNGIEQYRYENEITVSNSSKINDFKVHISGCDSAGICSKQLGIIPFIKVADCRKTSSSQERASGTAVSK